MSRRRPVLATALTAAASLAALSVLPASAQESGPRPAGDHLTVTVSHAGGGADGTRELYCHPARGSHTDPRGACDALDKLTRWGKDPFAPVPADSMCTMQYGGPATAQVKGVWAGRPVDARYSRTNGCEIDRWKNLTPVLPDPKG
ncbi:SSI family serine proteinase inhibitor [Streptomyces tsukubensis]|uniref:Subtilisin inhibitor domain-containing protein n=1 Tax=Streptomyces tsukubensis TaxID=83656 RepID=A0A1V4A9S2_9ACTN|nr:SSI family serine proteinase inhibitor [Streptomyces tsukubensis]OON79188.1 hypothetical protein B1H18_14550 [Streptomyces tsukubensis]QFR94699.1 hypothetical protein GBW32_18655 [Streptomyces tsukubensis]